MVFKLGDRCFYGSGPVVCNPGICYHYVDVIDLMLRFEKCHGFLCVGFGFVIDLDGDQLTAASGIESG